MHRKQGAIYREQVEEAAAFLAHKISVRPDIILQLGTGLGALAEAVEEQVVIPYAEIPHFPQSTVTSHAGNLIFGTLCGRKAALLQGRLHFYEGYSARQVAFPVRVLSLLGARIAVITNAAGGLNPDFLPGTIMVFSDHIYLLPDNPLRGPNVDDWGPRFPDFSQPYDQRLQKTAFASAVELGFAEVVGGTYVCIPGPSLETPAETRYLRMIGADAVGMSSLPEVLVAIHAGMQVLGLSVVANVNDPDNFTPILLDDIVSAAGRAGSRLRQLLSRIVPQL
ncbi:MAG TPA: purine-nucleoside phosphorylase [Desulfobulbaceae bacterium]|nr:purine-nucleoside phosphorylase [Desulfobulbaceae bacterium]